MNNNLNPSFLRTVSGYHNKLVADKDLLLADIQRIADNNLGTSEDICNKLDVLADIEYKLLSVRKHFSDKTEDVADEQKPTTEDS